MKHRGSVALLSAGALAGSLGLMAPAMAAPAAAATPAVVTLGFDDQRVSHAYDNLFGDER